MLDPCQKQVRPDERTTRRTRRQVIGGVVVTLGGLAAAPSVRGFSQEKMAEKAGSVADQLRTELHQDVTLKATPQHIYDTLMDSKLFAAFSHEAAEIVGDKVVRDLVEHWPEREAAIPHAP